jgi:hypothetical protein
VVFIVIRWDESSAVSTVDCSLHLLQFAIDLGIIMLDGGRAAEGNHVIFIVGSLLLVDRYVD